MTPTGTYFNENDQFAAKWLSKVFPGTKVDHRSIVDVQAGDVVRFQRAHFFGGIGGWELALQLAGWPEDFEVWTGSCPCQPFSDCGSRKGTDDERHLWPEFRRLIAECRPPTIFGEQVASKAGREWLAGVRSDLEALGYAVGAADLCAAGVSAPHRRQRLFWVGDSCGQRLPRGESKELCRPRGRQEGGATAESGSAPSYTIGMEHATLPQGSRFGQLPIDISRPTNWSDYDIIECRDGKSRRVKPGVRLLANGISNRVGRLRGYGNAISPQIAAEFVMAFMETAV